MIKDIIKRFDKKEYRMILGGVSIDTPRKSAKDSFNSCIMGGNLLQSNK